jgi:hypothetical protein
MTTPSLPTDPETAPTSRKPSVEHIVLGVVLIAVLLGAGGWLVLRGGSSSSTATKPPAAAPQNRPAVAALAEPGVTASPVKPLKAHKPAAKPLSKAAYLKAGNKICDKMNSAQKALGDFPASAKAQAAFFGKVFVITEHARKQLKALRAPTAGAAKMAKLYVQVAKLDATGKAAGKALAAGKATQAKQLEATLVTQSNKANASFNAYGLTSCGT